MTSRDLSFLLTQIIGLVALAADHETRWRRRRRLKHLAADLAAVANELSLQERKRSRNA